MTQNKYKYANGWVRFYAYLIDVLLLMPFWYFVIEMFSDGGWTYYAISDEWMADPLAEVIWYSFYYLYIILLQASSWKATIGMRALRIKIIRQEDGNKISILRAFLRQIYLYVSLLTLGLGLIAIFRDKKERKGWHDKWAKTFIVYD